MITILMKVHINISTTDNFYKDNDNDFDNGKSLQKRQTT